MRNEKSIIYKYNTHIYINLYLFLNHLFIKIVLSKGMNTLSLLYYYVNMRGEIRNKNKEVDVTILYYNIIMFLIIFISIFFVYL